MARVRAAAALNPARCEHHGDVVAAVEKRQQIGVLENEADLVEPQPAQIGLEPALVIDDFAIERDAAAARLQNAGDAMQQRGLAGTARSHQSDHLAGEDFHIDVAQGIDPRTALSEMLGQMLDAHDRLSVCPGHGATPNSRALPPGPP